MHEQISFIHQKVQSIGNSIDEINEFVRSHQNCVGICVTEHWKTEQQLAIYNLDNYYLAAKLCRQEENRHGGCAVYIKKRHQK